MKDVTNSTLTEIQVEFTPAVINVDYASVEKQLAAIVAQYTDYEVTASTYKIDYDERTRLNKLKQALEARRKEIKSNINNPYAEFEKWYKKTLKPLDEVIETITAGLNAVDEHERLMRVDVVRATFEDKCMVAGLEKSTFENKYEEYSLKKHFKTGKFELKKTVLDEMDALVLAEFEALEQFKANKQVIEEQAQEYDLPAEGYIRHFEDGKSLVDVLKLMKSDRDAIALRKEQQEARAKAEAERKAEIERMAQEQANANIKAIDAETGEIIENSPSELESGWQGADRPQTQNTAPEVAEFVPSEPVTVTMVLTLHGGKPQLDELKEYLEDNFISFETLGDL
ncbi:DUF1351 domain-containing protein [Streptococcus himalayensis]|uniref:DUF1351 domain-containing protein n=1 Tax=Streptococcus himalayensis TaxID=1888195 RepID=A0A917EF09_9STRE|nr:DUF1351 domain-containing protein [Streptococcus himalayensis]QBX25393.1 hypothetical protein Javan254_0038 [Streptococcus phage Javan254]GGE26478.1 hypothetical protein GCM10011510_04590 [Streptococcus himalayensis]